MSYYDKDTGVEEIILAPETFTMYELGTIAWDGSATAEGHWEGDNPSICHAKCTSIN